MLMKKQISDFQANGVVLLKGVLNDFVNDARVAIEENMAQPSWRERTYHCLTSEPMGPNSVI